jgi:hypothetical protein
MMAREASCRANVTNELRKTCVVLLKPRRYWIGACARHGGED